MRHWEVNQAFYGRASIEGLTNQMSLNASENIFARFGFVRSSTLTDKTTIIISPFARQAFLADLPGLFSLDFIWPDQIDCPWIFLDLRSVLRIGAIVCDCYRLYLANFDVFLNLIR
jgi:hypothetical protein